MHCLCVFCRQINVDVARLMATYYACVSAAPCVKMRICSYAHVAPHVHILCLRRKRRHIISSCQGDIAGEVELLT